MKLTGQNAIKYCIDPYPVPALLLHGEPNLIIKDKYKHIKSKLVGNNANDEMRLTCLLYTSPSPRDVEESRMPSSA